MANRKYVTFLKKQGVAAWNPWRRAHLNVRLDLTRADFRGVDLSGVNLVGTNLNNAILSKVNLKGATLGYADLRGANLRGANLVETHFIKANFSSANLSGADLSRAWTSSADFSEAKLSGAKFIGTDLYKANFRGADLSYTDFSEAILLGANFSGANLEGSTLDSTKFKEVRQDASPSENTMSESQSSQPSSLPDWLNLVTVVGSDLFIATATLSVIIQGLDVVERRWREKNEKHRHSTPIPQPASSASPQTPTNTNEITEILLVMNDGSEHGFRRWVTDPDALKTYIDAFSHPTSKVKPLQVVFKKQEGRSLVVDVTTGGKDNPQLNVILTYLDLPSNYSSLFISYAHQDESIAKQLHTDLRKKGVACWFAPHDLRPGTPLVRGIEEAIQKQDKLLLILSHHAVTSNWVQYESEAALHKQITSGQETLFPIRLDNAILESPLPWAKSLCKYHIGDFTHWQDETAYQQAFTTLLHNLKVTASPTQ